MLSIRLHRALLKGFSTRGHNSAGMAVPGPRDFPAQGQQTVSSRPHKPARAGSIPAPASDVDDVAFYRGLMHALVLVLPFWVAFVWFVFGE